MIVAYRTRALFIVLIIGIFVVFATATPAPAYTSLIYKGCTQGNNVKKTSERVVNIFNILEVSGAFTINILSNQTSQYVKITGDENILPLIATTTSGNKLLIHTTKSICSEMGITLDISVGNLNALVSSGSDTVKVHQLYTDKFSLVLEGAGDIELTGYAKTFDAVISGSGDLESRGLKTHTTRLNISGAGSANVHAADTLDVEIVGAADVYYSGDPKNVIENILGVGSLNKI